MYEELLDDKYEELWSIFKPPLYYSIGPEDSEYEFPTNRLTTFTGRLDRDTKFTFFRRTDNNFVDSSITTEGIALSPYYSSVKFSLNISVRAKEVRIYYLPVNYAKLEVINRYFDVDEVCFTVKPLGFYYFWIDSSNYSCSLSALSTKSLNNNREEKCIYRTKLTNDVYEIIPLKPYYRVSNLIQMTYYLLQKPIPLTPFNLMLDKTMIKCI